MPKITPLYTLCTYSSRVGTLCIEFSNSGSGVATANQFHHDGGGGGSGSSRSDGGGGGSGSSRSGSGGNGSG